ncbi:MAG: signal peptidase II [Patescibacteria group bacterium]
MKRLWIVGILLAAVLTIDRFTKLAFMKASAPADVLRIGDILTFTQHQNHGVIANLPVPLPIIVLLTLAALLALVLLLKRTLDKGTTLQAAGLAIAIGGALGNLWDRLQWSFVFDWILLFNRSIINVADIAIAVGLLVYLLARPAKQPII